MNSKVCVLILLFGNFQIIFGQKVISCNFATVRNIYHCDLTISNPTGSENFTEFRGVHQTGKFDSSVHEISGISGSTSTNIPSLICERFSNIQTMSYVGMGIEKVGENSFKTCTSAKSITLKDNKINVIDESAFSENTNLEKLDLSQNKLSTLPALVFDSLRTLTTLDLSSNEIVELSSEWFTNLESLQKLYLASNKISELPSGIFTPITLLQYLNLGYNKLTTINSESFGDVSQLVFVDLSHNEINAVDQKFLDKATAITSLVMISNNCADDNFMNLHDIKEGLNDCFVNFESSIGKNF